MNHLRLGSGYLTAAVLCGILSEQCRCCDECREDPQETKFVSAEKEKKHLKPQNDMDAHKETLFSA